MADIHGIHYSHAPGLTYLSGHMYGTGIRGAEGPRLAKAIDPRIKNRIYFYNKTTDKLPSAETGLGQHIYESHLNHIFDGSKATPTEADLVQVLKAKYLNMGADNASAFESALVDAGYHGYTNGHSTIVLNKDFLSVQRIGRNGQPWSEEPRVPSGNPDGGQWTNK